MRSSIDCQNDLSKRITTLNDKSKLFLMREAPQTLLPKLWKEWKITHLVFEKDTDAYARERDDAVKKMAEDAGVEVICIPGRTLWDSDELVKKNGNKPTMSITQVQHAGAKIGDIARPIPAPTSLPDPGELTLSFEHEEPEKKPDYNAAHREGDGTTYTKISGPNGDFAIPTIEELGLKKPTTPHRGGESIALDALDKIIANEDYTATFEKPKTAPTQFEPQATTLLSPHLHFGSLSCREFYWRVQDVVTNYKGTASKPPTSLTGQLLFRDMYFGAQASLGYSFGQTVGNPQCRFIPWHLPSVVDPSTKLITGEYQIDDPKAEEHFRRWRNGNTGFPWIDALMRQLKLEGWIHHLGRHAVACFLTRGGCYIDWERGAEVFEEWLIDHEAACNIGNWQWLSCTAFFSQFYRCYSPVAFPAKYDKTGAIVRKYCPELKNFGDKYIYEPWKAPIADQKRWGCLIKEAGTSEDAQGQGEYKIYPKPMFDFSERRELCIQQMKTAYHVGLRGDDPRVLDGTWRALFSDKHEGPTDGVGGGIGAMLGDVGVEVSHVDAEAGAGGSHVNEHQEVHVRTPAPPVVKKGLHKRQASGAATTGSGGGEMKQGKLDGIIKRTKR